MSMKRFPITLTQLTYFSECARTLNMTEASQRMLVAQSAVSTAITQLEQALGTTLFIRQHSKGLILTPQGHQLVADTQELFTMLSNTIEGLHEGQQAVQGSITIACFNTLAPFLVPQLLSRLNSEYPELEVEVLEGNDATILEALRYGRAELGVHYAFAQEEGLLRETIIDVAPHVIVDTKHRFAGRGSIALKDLADDPYIMLNLPSSSQYFLSVLKESGVEPRIAHRSSSYETVRSMVALGLGYSILNLRPNIKRTYTGEKVIPLEIEGAVPSLEIVVSTLTKVQRSQRAVAVTKMIRRILLEADPQETLH
ncbi:MAG: LysR substrate-binding domain-containing protein [Microbacteriaceae bacterium]